MLIMRPSLAADPVLTVKPNLETALAGVPAIVALRATVAAGATEDCVFYELYDPFMAYVYWMWDGGPGHSYKVVLDDLHYSAIPQPAPPRRITLKPGERRVWHIAVPTPASFGDQSVWTLSVRVRRLDDPQQFYTASATIEGRDPENRCVVEALGSTWAQATLLQWANDDAIGQLVDDDRFDKVVNCANEGDRTAHLILCSRALVDRSGVVARWRELENDVPEIRCLRNYLLLAAFRFTPRRDPLPVTEAEAREILDMLADEDYFAAELRELLEDPRQWSRRRRH